jgi:hypothetical protein
LIRLFTFFIIEETMFSTLPLLRLLIAALAIASVTSSACARPDTTQVPVRLRVNNRSDDEVTIRWKDNKISGVSAPIGPGQVTDLDVPYTTRGAGNLRVLVLGPNGQQVLAKRFEVDQLRAAKFSRKLTIPPLQNAQAAS